MPGKTTRRQCASRRRQKTKMAGVVFRYRNDRCYYFCGVQKGPRSGSNWLINATEFHKPLEKILAEAPLGTVKNKEIVLTIRVSGNQLEATLNDIHLRAEDDLFSTGSIGLNGRWRNSISRCASDSVGQQK